MSDNVTQADVDCVKAIIAKTSFSNSGALPTTSACEIAARHRIQQSGQTEAELLREALHRQCDNMAFVLNRVDLKTWHERFTVELAEDRTHLSQGEGA